jgi:hypothetical protein
MQAYCLTSGGSKLACDFVEKVFLAEQDHLLDNKF